MGLTELAFNFFNLVLLGNKYHDPSEVTCAGIQGSKSSPILCPK